MLLTDNEPGGAILHTSFGMWAGRFPERARDRLLGVQLGEPGKQYPALRSSPHRGARHDAHKGQEALTAAQFAASLLGGRYLRARRRFHPFDVMMPIAGAASTAGARAVATELVFNTTVAVILAAVVGICSCKLSSAG